MISGRQLLSYLDTELQKARTQMQDFETRVEKSSNQLVSLRQQESAIYRKLARLRIDSLKIQQFHDALDQAEKQAQSLLEQRNQAIQELAVRSLESQNRQKKLEAQRQQQAQELEEATTALQEKLDQVHQSLEKDPDYRAQQQETQEAINTLAAADEKTREAEQDRKEKGQPFRDDPLFMYLWNRHYGTSNYQANPLTRFFDRMLAHHIRYEASRQNYHRLLEIPKRLREHTDMLKASTAQSMDKLAKMERNAEKAAGIPDYEETLENEKAELMALDKAIDEAEEHYQELLAEHQKYTAGDDPLFQQAIAVLVANFKSEPIPELRRDAAATEGYEDDSLISQLAEIRHHKSALQETINGNHEAHKTYKKHLNELAEIRRRFKSYDYDAANSRFTDGESIDLLLQEFRQGQLSAVKLWRALERAQRFIRYNRQPTVGSIGFPRGLRLPGGLGIPSGTMRFPRGIRFPGGLGGGGRSGGIRFPSGGGGGGGGGFRTGGGF
jgi:hypothetical protein